MTVRSVPTSELAPRAVAVSVDMWGAPFISEARRPGSSADRRRDAEERADDDEDDYEEGPDELQVAVVADLRERQAAHDHGRCRRDEVHEAGRRLIRGDDERARDTGEVGERRQDRHH